MGSGNQLGLQQVPDTCVARQNGSSLHAPPFLSADAEGDTTSSLWTSLAGPESQGSPSASGTNAHCPSCPTSRRNKPLGSSEPARCGTTPHSSSLHLCNCLHIFPEPPRAGNSRSCYKGAVRSLPTTLEWDSNKPDDNAAPGFSLSTLGRTSRWQRNCLPHHRCRCQERFFLCFSPVLIFQEDEIV